MTGDDKIDLTSAIERLYKVFSPYTPPAHPTFCTHCVSDAEDAVLRRKSLREISAEELGKYSWKAISTWGTVDQFKYLLPRLFELVVTEFRYNPEILFKKPRYGGLDSWPPAEQAALAEYCSALWRYAVTHHPFHLHLPTFPGIEDCLCSIAQIVDDLRPLLQFWDSDASASATQHLAEFAAENASTLRENHRLSDSFWNDRPEQMKQVVDWFMTRDFSLVFDVAERSLSAWDFREELVRAVMKWSMKTRIGDE
jgi:hypothetical protein